MEDKMFQSMISKVLVTAAMALMFVAGVGSAKADTVSTFQLNVDFCSTLCFPAGGSGGSVMLTLFSTGVNAGDVEFDVSLNSPLDFHNSATNPFDTFAFNYVGSQTISLVSTPTGWTGLNPASGRKEDGACTSGASQCFTDWLDSTLT